MHHATAVEPAENQGSAQGGVKLQQFAVGLRQSVLNEPGVGREVIVG